MPLTLINWPAASDMPSSRNQHKKPPAKVNFKVSPARWLAFEILQRVQDEQAYAANLLASIATERLSEEDRALTHELVLGVLRHQRRLDQRLAELLARPLTKLDSAVLLALRLGLYQLTYLNRIPAHAAVNESVNLTRRAGNQSASGLVNAVLRKAVAQPLSTADIADPIVAAAIESSHPDWLIKRWAARLGLAATRALAEANNQHAPIGFRLNNLIASQEKILTQIAGNKLEIASSNIVPGGYRLIAGSRAQLLALAAQGLIHIQDEGSQLVAMLLATEPGMKVLDACAAPGGKATALAALMENQGLLVAGELHFSRARLIKEQLTRLQASAVQPVCYDASANPPFLAKFDRILLDVPCSGTGTLRRNPEIKARLTAAKITELAALQQQILNQSATLLADRGRLVYASCSLEPEENEAVIEKFLADNSQFQLLPLPTFAQQFASGKYLRTWPHQQDCDGFFAALLEKRQ